MSTPYRTRSDSSPIDPPPSVYSAAYPRSVGPPSMNAAYRSSPPLTTNEVMNDFSPLMNRGYSYGYSSYSPPFVPKSTNQPNSPLMLNQAYPMQIPPPIYLNYNGVSPYSPPLVGGPLEMANNNLSPTTSQGSASSALNIPSMPSLVPLGLASSAPTAFPSALSNSSGHFGTGDMSRMTNNSLSMTVSDSPRVAVTSGNFVPFNPKHRNLPLGRRMKVSRACDECRRKKTRCDFDAHKETCTPCRRAGVQCTFERAQLKRGPARRRYTQVIPHSPELAADLPAKPNKPSTAVASYDAPKTIAPDPTSFSPIELDSPVLENNDLEPPHLDLDQNDRNNNYRRARSVSASSNASSTFSSTETFLPPIDSILAEASVPGRKRTQSSPVHPSLHRDSNFPLLVEIACRQSESPKSDDVGPATPHSSEEPDITRKKSDIDAGLSNFGSSTDTKNTKTVTPPLRYDAGLHGVSHYALVGYYTFVHPTFPLLPDLVAEVDDLLSAAGSAKAYLVAALNNPSNAASDGSVPLSTQALITPGMDPSQTSAVREAHFIALILMYMRTLDASWLGAGVAVCATLLKNPRCARSKQLAGILVALDCMHSVLFELPSMLPRYFCETAKECERIRPLITLLRCDNGQSSPSPSYHQHFFTTPETVLKTLGDLHSGQISRDDAKRQLNALLPQLQHTPLERLVQQMS